MSLKNYRLEKLYAYKTKDLASLRTHDIAGARPSKRTWERKNYPNANYQDFNYSSKGKGAPGLPGVENKDGKEKYLRAEEYRPMRNPMHYADANILRDTRGINLKGYTGGQDVRRSMNQNSKGSFQGGVRSSHQLPLKGGYRDSLEQFKEENSMPLEEITLKHNYKNFYGVDNKETKDFIYKMKYDDIAKKNNEGSIQFARRRPKINEQTIFTKAAADQNVLFKNDLNMFFDPKKETPENFVKNYNQFFRGSTPNEGMRKKLQKQSEKSATTRNFKDNDKTDVYLYNFFTHKPKYVYTTDKHRMRVRENHYDKYANDFKFKDSIKKFFAVERNIYKPDYSKRSKAISSLDEMETLNRVYGSTSRFRLFNY